MEQLWNRRFIGSMSLQNGRGFFITLVSDQEVHFAARAIHFT
jgi:hypothetical protein